MSRDAARVVELRRYALHPGQREALVELFDREFVETQGAEGMAILGQFRDLDEPDSFVWLRGFTDMGSRKRGLEAFYSGPVWKAHAAAANATMVNVDNVLLLRPLTGLTLDTNRQRAVGMERFMEFSGSERALESGNRGALLRRTRPASRRATRPTRPRLPPGARRR